MTNELRVPLSPTKVDPLLQTEPLPVTSTELLLLPELLPIRPKWSYTAPPLETSKLALAPALPTTKLLADKLVASTAELLTAATPLVSMINRLNTCSGVFVPALSRTSVLVAPP